MDDIVRQFKGVSDGLKRAVGTSPSSATGQFADDRMSLSWNQEEKDNHNLHQRSMESAHSLSDGDSNYNYEDHTSSVNSGCHSDNEVNNRGHTSNDVKHIETYTSLDTQASDQIGKPVRAYSDSSNMSSLKTFDDPTEIPPEVHHTLLPHNLFDADHREKLFLLFSLLLINLLFYFGSGCQQMLVCLY